MRRVRGGVVGCSPSRAASFEGGFVRLKIVEISSELIAQMLTEGYRVDHAEIQAGLPKGAVLYAVLAPPHWPIVSLIFEHESFPDAEEPWPPQLRVVVAMRQQHRRGAIAVRASGGPQMLEELFTGYLRAVFGETPVPLPAPHQELRRAFMAGAKAFYGLLMGEISAGEEIQPQDLSLMRCLSEELDEFRAAVERGEK
jgi:hypothetical protein